MKKEVGQLDAIPSKRLFSSIISDYDLNRSVCELVDNAIDTWVRNGKQGSLEIDLDLDTSQQTISVSDNAGGLKESELKFMIAPGHTGNTSYDETIGIFGVGTKRAVVALAQDIKIKTRYFNENTFSIEFDESWLETEDWDLNYYEINNISTGTTKIELQRLRIKLTDFSVNILKEHLQATYARFIQNGNIYIILNKQLILPLLFENWAYPEGFEPREYTGELPTESGKVVKVRVLAGLTNESSPSSGEYGVYFYCNDRLVARGLKTFEVGFTAGLAGRPHPTLSLTRVIIFLEGEARSMPWNSSKSDINPNHHIFKNLRDWLVYVVRDYASVSRRWAGQWDEKVFNHKEGEIVSVAIDNMIYARKSYLPPAPKSSIKYADLVAQNNRKLAEDKPWTKGLYEGMIAADIFFKQKLDQKNRISLIVLDSTLEIAFKEYLVNESGASYSDTRLISLFSNRSQVHDEIKKYVIFDLNDWKKVDFYYRLRCKLVHERVTVAISDSYIEDYTKLINKMLSVMFDMKI